MFFLFLIWPRDDDAEDNEAKPNENEIAPTDGVDGVCENEVCKCGGHIRKEVQKARSRGDHTRIAEAWTIAAPEHRGGTVGGHDGKNNEYNIQYGELHKECQKEEHRRGNEHKKKRFVHITTEALVYENSDKCSEGDHEGANREDRSGLRG